MSDLSPAENAARTNVVPPLLLSAALQASPVWSAKLDTGSALSEEALAYISPLGLQSSSIVMQMATADVKALMNEAGCTNINALVLVAALASCLMFADRDECPASSKFGLGILMHQMIGSSDKVLDNVARAATAVALRCKQLHGRLDS